MEMKLEVVPIGVTDVDRAKEFYGQKFGFTIDVDQPWGATHSYLSDPDGNAWTIQQKPAR